MQNVNIEERSEMMVSTLKDMEAYFDKLTEEKRDIPATIELSLDSRAIAKSYRSNIRKLVDVNKKNNIIGLKNDDTICQQWLLIQWH
jgi:hypothetical protein